MQVPSNFESCRAGVGIDLPDLALITQYGQVSVDCAQRDSRVLKPDGLMNLVGRRMPSSGTDRRQNSLSLYASPMA